MYGSYYRYELNFRRLLAFMRKRKWLILSFLGGIFVIYHIYGIRWAAEQTRPLIESEENVKLEPYYLNGASFLHVVGEGTEWVSNAPNEKHIIKIFGQLQCGEKKNKEEGIVLDVGANTGIYGLYSAAIGCEVVMFDPQPQCQMAIRAAIRGNRFDESKVRLVPHAATADRSDIMVSNQSQCLTALSINSDLNGRHADRLKGAEWYPDTTVRIDDIVNAQSGPKIQLMKVDTEGAEYTVLSSAWQLFEKKRVAHFISELTPKQWPSFGVSREKMFEMFKNLWSMGYSKMEVLEWREGRGGPYTLATIDELKLFLESYKDQVDIHVTLVK